MSTTLDIDATLRAARKRPGTCQVVNQHCCAPANGEVAIYSVCVACGDHVCRPCSIVREWAGRKRQRVCHDCLCQEGDSGREEVAAHIFVQAGYSAEDGVRDERMRMARESGIGFRDSVGLQRFVQRRAEIAEREQRAS